ncbi:MAG: DNA-formamidopyrimidine glycosylase family protein [Actinomycetota bacterium]|nr:DNA glycosylase [Acidimicrobiaceae bacterium]MEC7968362.1 DNA-formamidopyrimidine glycosylase family protein [Actinomycetota bacterium]MEC8070428.1 DNA-formamidopyrimidine glycosylase family protein [Actinomycetota bacterium]
MPEGDTLFNTALALRPALLGESLTAVNIRARGMYRLRVGDTVRSVEAVGKFLEIVVERGLALRTHLHMTGVWHLYEQGERWRRPRHLARAVLETESHVAVCFAAPTVEVGPAADDRLAHLGPDLCHADVDLDAVLERVAGSDSSTEIAEVLLDQRLAAGIGNVYKNEVLWACEVSPFRSLADVDEPMRRRLYETAAEQLQANLGRWKRQTHPKGLAVYNRAGQGCYRCLGRIRTIEHGDIGRRTWWCADCQT